MAPTTRYRTWRRHGDDLQPEPRLRGRRAEPAGNLATDPQIAVRRFLQGIHRTDRPAFSFQGHPGSKPGAARCGTVFDHFIELMEKPLTAGRQVQRSSFFEFRLRADCGG